MRVSRFSGYLGRQLHGALQVLPRPAAAANAADDRGIAVKQPEVTIGPGVVELRVQLTRPVELALHLVHELECGQALGPGQLSQIHRRGSNGPEPSWNRARSGEPAGGDPLVRQGSALGIVGGELRQVETRAAELPGRRRLARRLLVARLAPPGSSSSRRRRTPFRRPEGPARA